MADNLLEVRYVTKIFSSGLIRRPLTVALEDFFLTIPAQPPTIVTIAGESGSGKTTLARLVLGFIAPTAGEILYKGKRLPEMTAQERQGFRREVQAIFQDPYEVYNPFYPVDRVLITPIRAFGLAKNKAEARKKVEEALERVGLRPQEILGRYPHQLSGGQRQRIIVARTLLLQPRLIVADEPVSMIDASLRATILDHLRKLHDDLGISILYITHDLATAYQISDSLVVLYRGHVAETGDAAQLIHDPKHPYTQLLISSIPVPDPDRRWEEDIRLPADETYASSVRQGCPFYPRCPLAMPICKERKPPLFKVALRQAAACFLYEGAPVAAPESAASPLPSEGL